MNKREGCVEKIQNIESGFTNNTLSLFMRKTYFVCVWEVGGLDSKVGPSMRKLLGE